MLGTVIALVLNVNSIELFHYVKHNAEGRERIIEYYEKNISQLEVLAVKSESPQSFDILKKEIDQQKTRIEDLSKSADMPVGFDKSVFSWSKIISIRDFIVLILGACLTGFAVSFGAPFWFDLLRKIYTLKKV